MILVTNDRSTASLRSLPHAAHLARALGQELLLVRVFNPIDPVQDDSDLSESNRRAVARAKDELASHVATLDVPATAHVAVLRDGERVWEAILRTAREREATCIAIATAGAGGIRSAVIGSVAASVMAQSPVPVMLVGPRAGEPRRSLPYHLLLTTDGSPASEQALPSLATLLSGATTEQFRLTLLRVYRAAVGDEPREVILPQLRGELDGARGRLPSGFPADVLLREDRGIHGVDRAIRDVAAEVQATAIWMASHGHSFRRRVLLGSVALSTVRSSEVPVIVTRAE